MTGVAIPDQGQGDFAALADVLEVAVFVVTGGGDVKHANPAARHLLDLGKGLKLRAGAELDFADPATRAVFQKLLTRQPAATGSFPVARADKRRPLGATLIPVGGDPAGNPGPRMFLLFVDDPWAVRLSLSPEHISRMLGLTKAEAAVALALSRGASADEIAEDFGLSRNTIRNQIAAVLQKTGVSRQSALVRLVDRLAMGLRQGRD